MIRWDRDMKTDLKMTLGNLGKGYMLSSIELILLKENVGSHSLLQGIFPIQGSNLGLLHYRQTLPSEPPWKPSAKAEKL